MTAQDAARLRELAREMQRTHDPDKALRLATEANELVERRAREKAERLVTVNKDSTPKK